MVAKGEARMPWLAACLMLAVVSPIWMFVGGFLLTPTRIVCVLVIPILSVRLFLMRSYGRVTIVDWLMFGYAFWVLMAYLTNNGMSKFVFGSMTASNVLGGYLVGRAAIRNVGNLQAVARWLVVIVALLLPFAFLESMDGQYVIPPLIDSIPGFDSIRDVQYGTRLGIYRVQANFAHPIHYGLYCSLAVSLYFVGLTNHVSLPKRIFVAFLMLGACFLSVSSGPFFAALFQLGLIGYMLITRNLQNQWKYLLWSSGAAYTIIELGSDRFGMYAIASRLAFDPSTAFYRRLIWEYGTAQAARTPWFGVGAGSWAKPRWMTDSIDNFWLQLAVSYGQPASYMMIAIFLIMLFRIGRGYVRGTDAYYMRVAWTFLFIGLSLSLSTVTIWNEVLTMIMFLIGAGVFMLQAEPESETPVPNPGRRSTGRQRRKRTQQADAETGREAAGKKQSAGSEVAYTRFPPADDPTRRR